MIERFNHKARIVPVSMRSLKMGFQIYVLPVDSRCQNKKFVAFSILKFKICFVTCPYVAFDVESVLKTVFYMHDDKATIKMLSRNKIKLSILVTFFLAFLYAVSYKYNYILTKQRSVCIDSQSNDVDTQTLKESIKWSEIKRRRRLKNTTIHERWIVVTSVSMPTEQVKGLSTIKGWKLVVVADLKTPENWKYVSIVYRHELFDESRKNSILRNARYGLK